MSGDRLNAPAEMRCFLCAQPINSEHFPRAEEDGSVLRFKGPKGEMVQHFVHRSCMASSNLPARATRLHSLQRIAVNSAHGEIQFDDEALAPEELAELIRRAYTLGWEEIASWPTRPPDTERIRINDPDNEGFHRDYLARFVEYP